jgi:hypothetical protein
MRVESLRIRGIAAGIELSRLTDLHTIRSAIALLQRSGERAQEAGYEVQELRLVTNPLVARLDADRRESVLGALQEIDREVDAHGIVLSIGPVLLQDRFEPELAEWVARLTQATRAISFSIPVGSIDGGVLGGAVRTAAQVIARLGRVDPTGVANFRFAAAACVPPGTPFFPVAYHEGAASLGFGVESAGLVRAAFAASPADAERRLREALETHLGPIEQLGRRIAEAESVRYLGIDPSPAPGPDRSIGEAIELLTGAPFGSASTLQACATITAALKSLQLQTCGYSGLMLPVLEDRTLARRAGERRYGLQELLLYSAVCGTGLDVIPLPADVSVDLLTRLVGDVATLAVRLRKPLSARLLPTPGCSAGEMARYPDERLVPCRVFDVDTGDAACQ